MDTFLHVDSAGDKGRNKVTRVDVAFAPAAAVIKGIQSFPLTRGIFHTILSHPTPAVRLSDRDKCEAPAPRGAGASQNQLVRRQYGGGGVMSDSIHIFRQRKIWIPFCRSVQPAAKV